MKSKKTKFIPDQKGYSQHTRGKIRDAVHRWKMAQTTVKSNWKNYL
jgi:hypothetical protein